MLLASGSWDRQVRVWDVETSGHDLVIVGIDSNGLLHIRTFDAAGVRTDTFETRDSRGFLHLTTVDHAGTFLPDEPEDFLPMDRAQTINTLKIALPHFLPPYVLSSTEKFQFLGAATRIVGHRFPPSAGPTSRTVAGQAPPQVTNPTPPAPVGPESEHIRRWALSPDGKRLAMAGRSVTIWDLATGRKMRALPGFEEAPGTRFVSVAFSRDGELLATAAGMVKLWEVASGSLRLSFQGFERKGIEALAFSPDGKRLAVGGTGMVRVRDTTQGEEILNLRAGSAEVHGLAFSPDGRDLAAATGDYRDVDQPGAVMVWDVATGRERLVLRGHRGRINAVAYNRDGTRLATGGGGGLVKIWEARSGQDLLSLEGNAFRVSSLAFSPDGRHLAAGVDRELRIWSASP
jgi:WD40 repeat protein